MYVDFVYRSVEIVTSSMRVAKTSRKLSDLREYWCVNRMTGLIVLMHVRKSLSLSSHSFHIMKMSSGSTEAGKAAFGFLLQSF